MRGVRERLRRILPAGLLLASATGGCIDGNRMLLDYVTEPGARGVRSAADAEVAEPAGAEKPRVADRSDAIVEPAPKAKPAETDASAPFPQREASAEEAAPAQTPPAPKEFRPWRRAYPEHVRQPAAAGTLYPADAELLSSELLRLQRRVVPPKVEGMAKVYLAPFGRLEDCGVACAHVYKSLQEQAGLHTVVLLSRARHGKLRGGSVWVTGGYATPLTTTPVNPVAAKHLVDSASFAFLPQAHAREAALELQVCFLQTFLPKLRIVPVLANPRTTAEMKRMADDLARIVGADGVALVVASNLSVGLESGNDAASNDLQILKSMETTHPAEIDRTWRALQEQAPRGARSLEAPYAVLIAALVAEKLEMDTLTRLHYANTAPARPVVGFAGAAFSSRRRTFVPAERQDGTPIRAPRIDRKSVSPEARAEMMRIAREALEAAAVRARYEAPRVGNAELKARQPLFVTLLENGTERGSAGVFVARKPMAELVADMTRAAATEDPTYADESLTARMAQRLAIEIAILKDIRPVGSWREVKTPVHGVALVRGSARGVILPATAARQGWGAEAMLRAACRKAGLREDLYKTGKAHLWTFTTEIFHSR